MPLMDHIPNYIEIGRVIMPYTNKIWVAVITVIAYELIPSKNYNVNTNMVYKGL